MILLEAKNIVKKYGSLEVLKNVNLTIQKGEIVSIVGASGAGKSTLLHILGTLDQPDSGEVIYENQIVQFKDKNQLAAFRNKNIGFVFQFHHLLPEFTALENVMIPALIAKKKENIAKKEATDLLKLLKLDHRMDHKPSQLSGGEQQRVAVARALVNSPAIVFADEPSGNLDQGNAEQLHQLFFDLRQEFGQTFVVITHNETLANHTDRKLFMKDGIIL